MKIPVDWHLLSAIATWTYPSSDNKDRPHLSVVKFGDGEAIACDGHRLVRLPLPAAVERFGLSRFSLLAIEAARVAISADRAGSIEINAKEARATLTHGRVALSIVVPVENVDGFPPIEQVMVTTKATAAPSSNYIFDPRYLAAIRDILLAAGAPNGVRCAAWSQVHDDGIAGPMQFENDRGIRFVVMPMRGM